MIYSKECSFQESYRISKTHIKTVGSKKMNKKGKICLNKKLGQSVRCFLKYLYACKYMVYRYLFAIAVTLQVEQTLGMRIAEGWWYESFPKQLQYTRPNLPLL